MDKSKSCLEEADAHQSIVGKPMSQSHCFFHSSGLHQSLLRRLLSLDRNAGVSAPIRKDVAGYTEYDYCLVINEVRLDQREGSCSNV